MKSTNKGFTLIEVMVAVGVIAIAIPALLFSMMAQIDGAGYLQDKLQAQWVAENILEEARIQNRLNGAVPEGSVTGVEELAGRSWFWASKSKAFAQKELSDIYGVEVSVWLEESKTKDPLVKVVAIIRKHKKEAVTRQPGESLSNTGPLPNPQGLNP
jgi:general secretion pathway protein I